MMPPPAHELLDWPPLSFSEFLLSKLPEPTHPETGEKVWETGGIKLHGAQRDIIRSRWRFIQLTGGWRAGKSFVAAVRMWVDIMWRWKRNRLDDLYWVVGPTYWHGQEEMNHLARLLTAAGIPHEFQQPKEASWSITFPHKNTRIETKTGSEAARLASVSPRGIVLAEANQLDEDVMTQSRGRVAQTRGWVFAEGTFEKEIGGQWFRRNTKEWAEGKEGATGRWYSLPSWDNRVLYPLGRDEPVLRLEESVLTPLLFMEKYGGIPGARSDAAMPEAEASYHIAYAYPALQTSFDEEKPVFIWSDPGFAHAYAVLAVQFYGNIAWVIDAVYRWNQSAEQIIRECASRPWAKNVQQAIMDVAARQNRAEGEPVVQQWAKDWRRITGQRLYVFTQFVPLLPGYEIHKRMLLNGWPEEQAQKAFGQGKEIRRITDPLGPRLMFDPKAAAALFGGMVDGRAYEGEYNLHRNRHNSAGVVTSNEPIDLYNDAIKAINYGGYYHFGPAGDRPRSHEFFKHPERMGKWEVTIAS